MFTMAVKNHVNGQPHIPPIPHFYSVFCIVAAIIAVPNRNCLPSQRNCFHIQFLVGFVLLNCLVPLWFIVCPFGFFVDTTLQVFFLRFTLLITPLVSSNFRVRHQPALHMFTVQNRFTGQPPIPPIPHFYSVFYIVALDLVLNIAEMLLT